MEYYAYASGDVEAMIAAMLVMQAVCGIFMLAYYILAAISYYNVAKIRKMENPWLAWIPVVNSFLVGKVADDINKDYHKTTHRGVTLLVLNLISALSTVIILAVTFPLVFDLIDSAVYYGSSLPDQIVYDFLGKLMMVFIFVLLLMVVGIWEMVLRYMSQYTVFKEYAPQSAGVYLAISLVCQFIAGITFLPYIFILVIYKKTPQFQVLNAARSYNYNPYGYNPGGPGQQYGGYNNQSGTPYGGPNASPNQQSGPQNPQGANPYSYNQNPTQPQTPPQSNSQTPPGEPSQNQEGGNPTDNEQ